MEESSNKNAKKSALNRIMRQAKQSSHSAYDNALKKPITREMGVKTIHHSEPNRSTRPNYKYSLVKQKRPNRHETHIRKEKPIIFRKENVKIPNPADGVIRIIPL